MEERDDPKPIQFSSKSKRLHFIDWNASGKYLATSSSDSICRIWEFNDNDLFRAYELKGFESKSGLINIKWHPYEENVLLTTGYDKTIKLYDTRASSKNNLDYVNIK